MPQVEFTGKWGSRSWYVTHDAPFYDNHTRPPHVEVIDDEGVRAGAVHDLINCRVKKKAIIWDVVGRTNNGEVAHFTVGHYGSEEEALARFKELTA